MNKTNSKTIKTATTPKATLQPEPGHYATEFLSMIFDNLDNTLAAQLRKTFGYDSPQAHMQRTLSWVYHIARWGVADNEMEQTHEILMDGINAATQTGACWATSETSTNPRTEGCNTCTKDPELEAPNYAPDFIISLHTKSRTMLADWLRANAPKELLALHDANTGLMMYEMALAENAGQVTQSDNAEVAHTIGTCTSTIAALGGRFSSD